MPEKQRKGYYHHATYSYRGLHENFIIGLLGEARLTVKANKVTTINNQAYQAYGMKFKLPAEHKMDLKTYNAEIHVLMTTEKKKKKLS